MFRGLPGALLVALLLVAIVAFVVYVWLFMDGHRIAT